MTDSKSILRASLQKKRRALPEPLRKRWSARIAEGVLRLAQMVPVRVIGVYWPTPSEPDIRSAVAWLLRLGRILVIPVKHQSAWSWARMDRMPDQDFDPRTGAGLQPAGGSWPQLIVLPGVAFDLCGHRLGQGGGIYDRLLTQHASVPRYGCAYPFQLVSKVPVDPHDQHVDGVVTPQGIFATTPDTQSTL